jgi:hypothetical protein
MNISQTIIFSSVFQRLDGKIRIVWSRESDSGKVLIRNGAIVSSGTAEMGCTRANYRRERHTIEASNRIWALAHERPH